MLGGPADCVLDTPINSKSHPLQRQALVDPLNSPGYGRLDVMDPAHERRCEVRQVLLPPGGPPSSASGEAILGSGDEEVERSKAANAGDAVADGFLGSGNADRDARSHGCYSPRLVLRETWAGRWMGVVCALVSCV